MAKKYVPDGACLVCNKGLGFGKLKVTNHKNVSIYGEKSATEGDKVTGLNIPSLGICSVTRAACQPVPTKWSGVQEKITIGPYRKLLEDSKLGCGIGGQISVYFSIPSAMLAVKNNMKENADLQAKKLGAKVDDWFKKQFDDAEKRNNVLPDGKARNFGLGVVEGIYGGVKGIGEGLLFLKKMQDKAMDASLHAITHPVETAGQVKDAAIATKDATVKAAEWVSNTDNLKNTAASIGEAHVKAYNWVTTSGNVQKAATSAYNGSVEKLQEAKEWAGKQSPRDWGNYTGRGAFEVGLMATGVGEAKAVVEGANVASKVGEGANVAGKLGEGANVVSKTAEAANVGEKAAEGANVVDKVVEGKKLGEVVSESKKVKLVAGTAEHKAARWAAYEKRGGKWSYERWSKQYDVNMKNATYGLEREQAYRDALGGVSKTVKTPLTNRQIDIFNESKDYMGQLKTGKLSLSEQVKLDILKDKTLVDKGFDVEYILEKGASKPCLEALKEAGVKVHIGPKIPI